jgi:uncharacterized protein YdcH (DUF465 family)
MENHTITQEFPEYADKISELKISDAQFLKLFVNYEVNALILHYEDGEQSHTTDEHPDGFKEKKSTSKRRNLSVSTS